MQGESTSASTSGRATSPVRIPGRARSAFSSAISASVPGSRELCQSRRPSYAVAASSAAQQPYRRAPVDPRPAAHLSSANHLHGIFQPPDGIPPLRIHQGQSGLAAQARPLADVRSLDWYHDVVAWSGGAPRLSVPLVSLPDADSTVSVSAISPRTDHHLHPQVPRDLTAVALNVQPRPAAPAMPNAGKSSPRKAGSPGNVAPGLQIVQYGQEDPQRPLKRRDDAEDRQRKEEMSKGDGVCLKCKKTRKRCDSNPTCNQCWKAGSPCIRSCKSCRSNKKLECDKEQCCKNCKRLGKTCVRVSASYPTTEDKHPWTLTDGPSQAPRHIGSAALVNEHVICETGSSILAPTAWNTTFNVPQAPQYPTEPWARGAASKSGLGSQAYSQQSTDVDPFPAFTEGSTEAASDDNRLQVPRRRPMTSDMHSDATDSISFFSEATHFSDQGSPALDAVDGNVGFAGEDDLWGLHR